MPWPLYQQYWLVMILDSFQPELNKETDHERQKTNSLDGDQRVIRLFGGQLDGHLRQLQTLAGRLRVFACGYECEGCSDETGKSNKHVYGTEELMLRGRLEIVSTHEEANVII